MIDFFWSDGHLGWGIFALMVFSGLWVLTTDLVWRLKNVRIVRLAVVMAAGWIIGVAIIMLMFWFGQNWAA